MAVLGWWGNGRLRDTIEDELKAQLTATLNANVTALGIWTTNQTRLATSLAEDPTVRTARQPDFSSAAVRAGGKSPRLPELEQFDSSRTPAPAGATGL